MLTGQLFLKLEVESKLSHGQMCWQTSSRTVQHDAVYSLQEITVQKSLGNKLSVLVLQSEDMQSTASMSCLTCSTLQ